MERQVNSKHNMASSAGCTDDPSLPTIDGTNPPPSIGAERGPMKLIPWEDIWRSLHDARIRGHGEMIQVFYETLFKEAVFDDYGAWSEEQARHH